MEKLGMKLFGDVYRGKRALVTGHTGFKGSWLSLWLSQLGAEVVGISLAPETQPNHWSLLGLEASVQHHEMDIRQTTEVARVFKATQPEVVFHLAAQPLVRRSYRDPLETWSTNVMGTASVMEACRQSRSVRAILAVTTDKCYENQEWAWGYRETDRLGGHDPYSASKAGSELVAASYRSAFFHTNGAPLLATARAGNVIGGGDWSEDRLIPDLVRAMASQQSLEIRSPNASRPWQHVLESLSGYLLLGQKLIEGDKNFDGAWNFGPERSGNRTVAEVLNRLQAHWPEMQWQQTLAPQPHEANLLYLDSAKAHGQLGWQSVWNLDTTLEKTADWYRSFLDKQTTISTQQLAQYVEAARSAQAGWVTP
ncbi:CDP-glucose 4,6-dehydratase [Limnohabitans sp. Rim28]|nr:CDP-glucose 4,6-dehydratase [Limnohabitans sp. Rim28]